MSSIQALGDTPGRVYLVGEIVDAGQASEVEIAVTDPSSIEIIRNGVDFPTEFSVVQEQPEEQFIEVTPGTEPAQGGAPPELSFLGG